MMRKTTKNSKLLRTLISEMILDSNKRLSEGLLLEFEPHFDFDKLVSYSDIKSSFESLENTLQSGYDKGVAEADQYTTEDQSINNFIKEARPKKDELYVNIAKHALLTKEVGNILDDITSFGRQELQYAVLDELANDIKMHAEFGMSRMRLDSMMSTLTRFMEGVGHFVGHAYRMMTAGDLGGKEKVKIKLAQKAVLGSNVAETLENLAEFIEDLEKLKIDQAYLKIMKKKESKNWFKKKRNKYKYASSTNIFEFATERAAEFSNQFELCKSTIQKLHDDSKGLEKLLGEILKASEVLQDMGKSVKK